MPVALRAEPSRTLQAYGRPLAPAPPPSAERRRRVLYWVPKAWVLVAQCLGTGCPRLGYWVPKAWVLVAQCLGTGCPRLGHWVPKAWVLVSQSILAKRVPVSMLGIGSPSHSRSKSAAIVVGCVCGAAVFLGTSSENSGTANPIATNHDRNQCLSTVVVGCDWV